MKKYLALSFTLAIVTESADAQIIMPAKYDSSIKINYVRTWEAMAPITHADTMLTRPNRDVREATAYFDGLGRPLQTVVKKGSLVTGDTARDMVSSNVYDEFGREEYKFLPFAANNTGSNNSISDGKFKLNPFQQDSTFNKEMFSDETFYYSKNVFEASPLNRIVESYAPGDNWVGTASQSSEADRRGIKIKSWINTVTDSVMIWDVTDIVNSFGVYDTSGLYAAGSLYKNVSEDEHNKQVIEFKDKDGKVILKKVQLTAEADTGTGKGYYGWLCTYYIYDDLGNLRCVVQPKGVELLADNGWSMSYSSGVILAEQCFRYEYDGRNRMILKKVPGSGIVYLIYDARDRLVMSQDSVMRMNQKWMYTLYDALNRPAATGLITDATYYNNAAYHRGQAENSTAYPDTGSYANEALTKTFYDNYDWRSGESNPLSATRNTSYDGYLNTASNTAWPYPQDATVQSNQVRGMVTGTKTKVLDGGSIYLYSVSFYDDRGRTIQTQSTNYATGTDINTVQYSWAGQPLLTISKNEKAGANAQTSIVVSKVTYDELWRVSKMENKIATTKVNSGSMPGNWAALSQHEYDPLGQLKKKKLGSTPVDSLTYDYNIRGWMLGMNRNYVKDTTSTANWFGFDLGYDKTGFTVNSGSHSYAAAQYNGNINGLLWKSTGDDLLRKYDFTYDAVNRIVSADFNQLNSNSFNKGASIDFSIFGMGYDANGNILSMNQKGWKLGGSVTIDSLVYVYIANSNKLSKVTDIMSDPFTKLGDFNDGGGNTHDFDYTYDDNGNLRSDWNKNFIGLELTPDSNQQGIYYNHLNLPVQIQKVNIGEIKYVYDAVGVKLSKIVGDWNLNTTKTILYLGGIVFEDDILQFIGTEEGRARIKRDSSAVVYDYMIRDHLGNVRMMLTEERDTAFYPVATMETANATIEETFYSNLTNTRADVPSGYPSNTPPGNAKVAKLQGYSGGVGAATVMIGPAMVLKVMAGDKFDIVVNSWWRNNGSSGIPANPASNLLSAMSTSISGIPGGHETFSDLVSSTELSNSVTSFLNNQSYNSSYPKAYVNWILLDERFNLVSASSGFEQVGAQGYGTHPHWDMPITKNGYLYVYVSNASPNHIVYFDNLKVNHIRGPLISEDHYYPFGLTMAGISSKALNGIVENKKKWNKGSELQSKEFSDGSGLELYATQYRSLDPQIGRFWQIDPRPDYSQSLYSSMSNNPISFNDPLGDSINNPRDQRVAARIEAGLNGQIARNNQSVTSSQNTVTSNNTKLTKLRTDVASGSLSGKDLKNANKEIGKLESSNNKANSNITEMQGQNAQLNQSLGDIASLRNDVNFNYTFGGAPGFGSGEHGVLRGSGNNVIIQGSNDGLNVHEIRHIGQSLANGGLRFSPNPATFGRLINAGSPDRESSNRFEVNAYQAQFSFDRNSYPAPGGARVLSDINTTSLRTIIGDSGGVLY